MAKSLFIFLFFSLYFISYWTYNYKMERRKVSRDFVTMLQWWRMVTSQVTVTVCHMTRVTWGLWESKHIATVVKCISSREISENSIKFSLSNSEQRDSWLNSGHWTLDADTRTRFHFRALSALDLAYSLISSKSTLGHWSSWPTATSIHSWALGLRGLCSQLGTACGDIVPSSGIALETWPCNWVVLNSILIFSFSV